jgi:hypothetical protein
LEILNLRLKLWVTLIWVINDYLIEIRVIKIICINLIQFRESSNLIYFGKDHGSVIFKMIKLSKEQLEERLYSDYKEVLMKLFIKKPIAAEMLAMEMILLKLHW